MKRIGPIKISGQLVIVLALLFGIHNVAHAQELEFAPLYKVERCDCLGFDNDIPTFLSDLAGADSVDELYIFGEGETLQQAEESAQNLCIETYRSYASVAKPETMTSVTQSGCQKLKSTPDGRWVSL
jgi:hypothetical protein